VGAPAMACEVVGGCGEGVMWNGRRVERRAAERALGLV
jgi:hypothetical protein